MKELFSAHMGEDIIWTCLGFFSQALFFSRFIVQWIVSEIKQKSVVPVSFWYLSILGSIGLLVYSMHVKDVVFIAGSSVGVVVYARNLFLINKRNYANPV